MGFNNVPVNGWPQIKDLERLNELAQKIDGMSTITSSDRDWLDEWESKLPELPEDPASDGIKVLTATTDDGETVKSWEDPASGMIDYSTTEQATGCKWIDGKEIYQKSFSFDNVSNAEVSIDISALNVERIVKSELSTGMCTPGNMTGDSYFYISGDSLSVYYNTSTSSLVVRRGESHPKTENGYVTIQYTKSTT